MERIFDSLDYSNPNLESKISAANTQKNQYRQKFEKYRTYITMLTMLSNDKLFEFDFSSSRPYDFSLVELESGNYINANKIPFGTFSVIATQGMAISTESLLIHVILRFKKPIKAQNQQQYLISNSCLLNRI